MENIVWKMDPDTRDLIFDGNGLLETIGDDEAAVQCVRQTLGAWKGDFELVPSHGTDYEKILGERMDEDTADEVIREAIFQEDRVAALDDLTITTSEKREIRIAFVGTLSDGEEISMEVEMDG